MRLFLFTVLPAEENTCLERTDVPGTQGFERQCWEKRVFVAARVSPVSTSAACCCLQGGLGVAIYSSGWLLRALSIFESGYIIRLIRAPTNGWDGKQWNKKVKTKRTNHRLKKMCYTTWHLKKNSNTDVIQMRIWIWNKKWQPYHSFWATAHKYL